MSNYKNPFDEIREIESIIKENRDRLINLTGQIDKDYKKLYYINDNCKVNTVYISPENYSKFKKGIEDNKDYYIEVIYDYTYLGFYNNNFHSSSLSETKQEAIDKYIKKQENIINKAKELIEKVKNLNDEQV